MLSLSELEDAVENKVALRTINKLYPAGGEHSKVFPSTYEGGVYAIEDRLIGGSKTTCVLLDSVASQANRMEEALQQAIDSNKIKLPLVQIDFSNHKDEISAEGNRLTSLQAPHRISDALFGECTLNGQSFRESPHGKKIFESAPYSATSLFSTCPTALLFGMWDSTGPKGGLGNKFERAITSEIVGINAVVGVGTQSRIDPLISKTGNTPVHEDNIGSWTINEEDAKKDEKGKPVRYKNGKLSSVNLGNIAPSIKTHGDNNNMKNPLTSEPIKKGDIVANGATIEYAEQTCVISLAGLRKLHFPLENDSKINDQRDNAARTVLTAMGILSFTLSVEGGLDLRSRCVLAQKESATWDVLGSDKTFALTSNEAVKLLEESVKRAKDKGLPWNTDAVVLSPNKTLIKAIKNSQSVTTDKSQGN